VLIPLRNYFGSRPFIDYVRDVCRREFGELASYFYELLSAARLALLIDGLNEIPTTENVDHLREIRAFLTRHPTIFVTVTCRVADYTPERSLGLDSIEIAPLSPPEIRQFISQHVSDAAEAEGLFWSLVGDDQARSFYDEFLRMGGSVTAFWLHTGSSPVRSGSVDRPYYHWNLWLQVRDDPLGLLTLARNPYLLTMIIRVYLAKGRPTGNRYELFSVFFQVMYETGHRKFLGPPDQWISQLDQASMLTSLAREMLERAVVTLTVDEALKILPSSVGRRFLTIADDERLLDYGEGVTFSHQLLREYFAAAHVEEVWRSGASVAKFLAQDGWWLPSGWEEAIILLAGKFADDPARLLNWLRDDQPELTSQCIMQSGIQISSPYGQSLAAAWVPRLHGDDPAPGRAAVGRALGRLDMDTRPGVCLLNNDGLPALEWATISESKVRVGNVDHDITIPRFQMSRYLITNFQFRPFITDGGYSVTHRDCWTSVGWNWKLIADRQGPDDYTEVFRLPDHPRIGTVWYEAHAYCKWLTKRMRAIGSLSSDYEIRLPTEAEWEAAARGAEGIRLYPWGDEFSYDRCNIRDIRSTSAVGLYQSGASPDGVYDLVGNAWSWCLTQWDDDPTTQNNDPEGDGPRVYRGGSWAFDFNVSRWRPHELRCDQRYWIVPLDDRPDAIGFFVVKGRC
jgi:formylglycine-generating enzyme required for sulfatase activity